MFSERSRSDGVVCRSWYGGSTGGTSIGPIPAAYSLLQADLPPASRNRNARPGHLFSSS